jgi:hypothetical protein
VLYNSCRLPFCTLLLPCSVTAFKLMGGDEVENEVETMLVRF